MNPNTVDPYIIPRTALLPVLVPQYPVILSTAKDLPAKPPLVGSSAPVRFARRFIASL